MNRVNSRNDLCHESTINIVKSIIIIIIISCPKRIISIQIRRTLTKHALLAVEKHINCLQTLSQHLTQAVNHHVAQ